MDPLESEDSAGYADAWMDLRFFLYGVIFACVVVYVLVPLFNPSWMVL